MKIDLRDSVKFFCSIRAEWRAFSTAAVLRATMYKCFDYDLRNEEMTASRVSGISVTTERQNGPSRLYLSLDLLREELSGGSDSEEPTCNAGDLVQHLGPADTLEKEMATSCLGNPMDGGAWQTTVHGVANRCTFSL